MRVILPAIILAAIAACSAGDSGGPARVRPQLAFVAGDAQSDTVGTTLPVQLGAKLSDALSGAALPGRLLNWTVVDGNGTVFVTVTQTGSDGIGRNGFTLGTRAGGQAVVARYVDPETGELVTFDTARATAVPGRAVQLLRSVDTARAWIEDPLRAGDYANAFDQYMNLVGAPVFAPAGGWSMRADTAWPAAEIRTDLTLTRDNLQATLPVIALRDLRRHRWNLRYTCGDTTITAVTTAKTDPALWYWTIQSVNLQALADSVTLFESAPHQHGFDLWFSKPTLIRGLLGQLVDGTRVHSADTSHASSHLRINAQGIGWVVPYSYESQSDRSSGGSTRATWTGTAYVGGDVLLCRPSVFKDFPSATPGGASVPQLVLEALP